jgi:polysaccharide export outer membrane protein
MTKVGQVWGRLYIVSCLWLAGLLLVGCQTNSADSGFSEVPGVVETTPATTPAPGQTAVAVPVPPTNPGATVSTNADLSAEIIRPGNVLLITFGDLPVGSQQPPFNPMVRDDGTITLIYNQPFQAAGKRVGDLEKEVRNFYVPAYFRNLTVTVLILGDTRFYYVDGEVRNPGKFPYVPGTTVSKAIASASGFTDFASKGSVKLIRADGRKQTINYNKALEHPELDPQVYPNDRVHVARRLF